MKKYLIVLGGPTASGKTSTAIRLSQHFDAPILNCDSRQFYQEMEIGTAKPTVEERRAAPHFFVDNLHIFDRYDVGDYEQDALRLLEKIYQTKEVAILTGGSGLFIRAVCKGLNYFPEITHAAREETATLLATGGIEALQQALQQMDPVYYRTVDLHNPRRLSRALEVCLSNPLPYSHFLHQKKAPRFFQPFYLYLEWEREALYARSNQRVIQMMEDGLEAEARALFAHRELRALQTVGYRELFAYFKGQSSLEEAIAAIQRNSRRYAKRQMTWFRNDPEEWFGFHPKEWEKAIAYVKGVMS